MKIVTSLTNQKGHNNNEANAYIGGPSRRQFLKGTTALVAGAVLAATGSMLFSRSAYADPPYTDLEVPRPLDPSFIFTSRGGRSPVYRIFAEETTQDLGLATPTTVWGYGNASDPGQGATFPGRTFFVNSNKSIKVRWENRLPTDVHLLDRNGANGPVLDESLHWADPATGRPPGNTIDQVGPPIVTHVHGGRNLSNFDGLPEYWFTPNQAAKGPLYKTNQYNYPINPEASTLWYHDHALGITRLNVMRGWPDSSLLPMTTTNSWWQTVSCREGRTTSTIFRWSSRTAILSTTSFLCRRRPKQMLATTTICGRRR